MMGKKTKKVKWRRLSLGEEEDEQSLEAEAPQQRQDGQQRNSGDGNGQWLRRDYVNGTYYGPAEAQPPSYAYDGRRTSWDGGSTHSPSRRVSNRFCKPPQYYNNVMMSPFEPQSFFNAPVMPMIYFPGFHGGLHRPYCPVVMPQANRYRPLQPLDWFNVRIPANCQYYFALSQPPRNNEKPMVLPPPQPHPPEMETPQVTIVDPPVPPPSTTTMASPGISAENTVVTTSTPPTTASGSGASSNSGVPYVYPGYSFGPAVFKTSDFLTSGRHLGSTSSIVKSPKKRKRKRKRKSKAKDPAGASTPSADGDLSDADCSKSTDSYDSGLTNGALSMQAQPSVSNRPQAFIMEGNEQSLNPKTMEGEPLDISNDFKKPRTPPSTDLAPPLLNGNAGDAVTDLAEINGNFDEGDSLPALPASQEVKILVDNILSSALEEATLGIKNEILKFSPSTSVDVSPFPSSSEIPEDLLSNFVLGDGEILEILQPDIVGNISKAEQNNRVDSPKVAPPSLPTETLARDFPKLPLVDNLFTVNLVDDIINSAIDEAVYNPPIFENEDVSDLVFLGQSTLPDDDSGSEGTEDVSGASETTPREPVERTLLTEILFVSETSFMDDIPEEKEFQEDRTDETSEQKPGSPSVQLNPDAPVFVPSFLKENEDDSPQPQDGTPETEISESQVTTDESPISESLETVVSPSAIHDEETSVTSTEEIVGSPDAKRTLNLDSEKDLTAEVAAELSALDEMLDSEIEDRVSNEEHISIDDPTLKPSDPISDIGNKLLKDSEELKEVSPQSFLKSDETSIPLENVVTMGDLAVSSLELSRSNIRNDLLESVLEDDDTSVANIGKEPANEIQVLEDAIQRGLEDLPHSEETKKLLSLDKEEGSDHTYPHPPETMEKPINIQQTEKILEEFAQIDATKTTLDLPEELLDSVLDNETLDGKSLNISENPISPPQPVPFNPPYPDISGVGDSVSVPAKDEIKLLDLEEVDLSSELNSSFQEQQSGDAVPEQQALASFDTTQDVFTKETSVSNQSPASSFQAMEESEPWQKDDAKETDGSSLSNFLPVDGKISPALISLENDTDSPSSATTKKEVVDHPLSQNVVNLLDEDDAELEGDFDYVGEKYMTESQEFYNPTKFKNYYQICTNVDVPDSPRDHASQAAAALQSQTPPVTPPVQPQSAAAKFKTSVELSSGGLKGRKMGSVPMDNLQPRTSEIVVHEADDLSECGSEDIETIGHRYEASEAHRHLYVNRLSLAAELLGTSQDLPYDDEFKPLVDSEGTVIAAPPPTPASPFTGAESHSNRHIYDSYYGSRDAPTSSPIKGSVAGAPLRSSGGREISDSGVQSEESGDDADDVSKSKSKKDRSGKSDDEQEAFDKTPVTGFSYKQLGGGRRPITSVLKGKTDPLCLCCNIM